MTYSNVQIENQSNYKYNAPTTIYSQTHVEGQPSSSRYSYGYKIINGDIDDLNSQHQFGNADSASGTYRLSEPDRSRKVFDYTTDPNTIVREQNTDKVDQKNESDVPSLLKPIIVESNSRTMNKELKKHQNKTD